MSITTQKKLVKSSNILGVLDKVKKKNDYREVTIKIEVNNELADKIEYINNKISKVLNVQPSKIYGERFGVQEAKFFNGLYQHIIDEEGNAKEQKSSAKVDTNNEINESVRSEERRVGKEC